jgi:hypothetical protein
MTTTLREDTGHDYESTVREMITRENDLTNQRMLWMAAFNGLLFAALGFAWDKAGARFLTLVFSILGVAASFSNGLALIFASTAQRRLLFWWHSRKPRHYDGPGVMGYEPLDKGRYSLYITPWILLSFVFTAGWFAILLFALRKS